MEGHFAGHFEAIRNGLPLVPPASWPDNSAALADLFHLAKAEHTLAEKPHQWAKFGELQVTKGFEYFLTECADEVQHSRAIAFVRAAAHCARTPVGPIDPSDVEGIYVTAEKRRVDLLVELQSEGKSFGVVVEAKFRHKLTRGQLENAKEHACGCSSIGDRAWVEERSSFLAVAPTTDRLSRRILAKRENACWRAISWWAILNRLERETDPSHDCADYRRFRRTVWHLAY